MQFKEKDREWKMKNETYGVSSREARQVFAKMPIPFSQSFTPFSHSSFFRVIFVFFIYYYFLSLKLEKLPKPSPHSFPLPPLPFLVPIRIIARDQMDINSDVCFAFLSLCLSAQKVWETENKKSWDIAGFFLRLNLMSIASCSVLEMYQNEVHVG